MANNCARCGAEMQPGETVCITCGMPAGWNRLAEFCRVVGCAVRELADDPGSAPEIENWAAVVQIRCQSCRAWQYDRFMK